VTQPLLIAGAIVLVIFAVVVVHESGHFVVGKLAGIRVDEFSVGFGPKLLSRVRGETQYSLRLLPLGGFVRMAGMLGLPGEADAGDRNFYRASIPKRFATIVAGIVFNFVFAAICFALVNMADSSSWSLLPAQPAARAGIPHGAVITSIDGREIRDDSFEHVSTDLHAATAASQGRPMSVTYRWNGAHKVIVQPELSVVIPVKATQSLVYAVITHINGEPVGTGDANQLIARPDSLTVSGYVEKSDGSPGSAFSNETLATVEQRYGPPAATPQGAWLLGVRPGWTGQSFPVAIANGFTTIPAFVHDTAVGIYQLITVPSLGGVNGPQGLSGPVGIAQATATATHNGLLGPNGLVHWIGFISMNLGLINVLPIPFLDGGKLVFLLVEAVRRKRLEPRHEAIISAVGLALVVLLLIYVTIGDVSRLTTPQ
jgi:regulator of sigma E protease